MLELKINQPSFNTSIYIRCILKAKYEKSIKHPDILHVIKSNLPVCINTSECKKKTSGKNHRSVVVAWTLDRQTVYIGFFFTLYFVRAKIRFTISVIRHTWNWYYYKIMTNTEPCFCLILYSMWHAKIEGLIVSD